jgi:hypothetical protein
MLIFLHSLKQEGGKMHLITTHTYENHNLLHVCMYSYQPEGWLDPHTVLAPDARMHTHIPACTAHPIPPL